MPPALLALNLKRNLILIHRFNFNFIFICFFLISVKQFYITLSIAFDFLNKLLNTLL